MDLLESNQERFQDVPKATHWTGALFREKQQEEFAIENEQGWCLSGCVMFYDLPGPVPIKRASRAVYT